MFNPSFFIENFPAVLDAVPLTLWIAFCGIVCASIIGLMLTVIVIKKTPVLYQIAAIFMSFSRSVPNLTILYFLYFSYPYFIATLQGDELSSIGAHKLNPVFVAILTFTITFSVYFAEAFRSAFYSIDKGQIEAALSIGLPKHIIFRRVIVPQASVQMLPNYTSVVIDMIKDTSLVYTISVMDIMGKATFVAANGLHYIEAYLIALVIYIILCSIIAISLRMLRDRMSVYQ